MASFRQKWWARIIRGARSPRQKRPLRLFRPSVEQLECRWVPATPQTVHDLYVFRSPGDPQPPNPDAANFGNTVLALTVGQFAGVQTPITFDPSQTYNFNVVDVTGHLNPDFIFRASFASPQPAGGGAFTQVVTLNLLQGNSTTTIAQYTYSTTQTIPPAAFPNNVTFPGDAIATGKFIAGMVDDSSYIDFVGLNNWLSNGGSAASQGFPRPAGQAVNFYHNANTLALILEVPTTKLTTANPPLLGVWGTEQVGGMQVNRVGRPLVESLLVPPLPHNDPSQPDRHLAFEQGSPATDVANFHGDMMNVLTKPMATGGVYGLSSSQASTVLDSVFGSTIVGAQTGMLPDILTVDLSKQYQAASNGFPNGRRLRDDGASKMLGVVTGGVVTTDNVPDDNGSRITDGLAGSTAQFPYLGTPNVPPGGPMQFATEATAHSFTLDSTSDPNGGMRTVSINWGDNTTTTFIAPMMGSLGTQSHTYLDEGTYTMTVMVTDIGDNQSGTWTFQVAVADPNVVASGSFSFGAVEGTASSSQTLATFTDPAGAEANDGTHYSASINWGDGSLATTGSISFSGTTFTVMGSHTYMEEGSDTITITINHENSTAQTVTSTATVSNPNVVATGSFSFSAVEATASASQVVATFTDPGGPEGLSDYAAQIVWGDGMPGTVGNITLSGTTFTVMSSHTYGDEGSYTITVTIAHENSTPQSVTDSAMVSDPNIVAGGGFSFAAAEGALSATQTVATFTDPAGAEPNDGTHYTASINWGDSTPTSVGTISFAGGTFTVSGNHSYAEEGTYTISVTINHEATSPQTVTDTVPVSNPAIVAKGGFTFSASEGATFQNQPVATFTDPGGPEALADYTANINWGDGSPSTAGTLSLSGTTFTVLGSHTYGEEGGYTIQVTISHENTGAQMVSSSANVSDPAAAGSTLSFAATAGAPFFSQAVATFTDPGGAEPNPSDPSGTINTHYKIMSINWGDGTPLDTVTGTLSYNGSPGSKNAAFTVTGNHTYAAQGSFTPTVLINHEGIMSTATGNGVVTVTSLGQFAQGAQTRSSSFWASIVGQELLRRLGPTAGGQTLGQWLASSFPKLYGGVGGAPNLGNLTNAQVGGFYLALFTQFNTNQLDAEVLATALYDFATTSSLGGTVAAGPPYNLLVNAVGFGAYSFNIGFNGSAFGVPNLSILDVFQILQAANNSASMGEPWGTNLLFRNEGLSVFRPLNGDGQQTP